MQVQRPTFRTDLIAKPVTMGATRLFELHCPSTGRTLRFSEDGYSIAYLLNGDRTLAEVAILIRKQRGLSLSVEKLASLIKHLDVLGCLAPAPADPNLTVPYNAVLTVAIPVLGDGGLDEALETVVLNAESFKDYYTIVPDDEIVAAAPVKSRSRAAEPARRAKQKSSPPPIPARSKAAHMPTLPPLPAWPPLENSIRKAAAAAVVPPRGPLPVADSRLPLAHSAHRFPVGRVRAKRSGVVGAQSLWLAGGFFAAALLWASWALFRLA